MRRVILLWRASTVLILGLFLPLWAQEIPLTSDSYDHWIPQWSPDGSEIVYQKWDATSYAQIYKVPAGGGTETTLTSDSYNHREPQWSPDGSEIVYYKFDETGYRQIYKISSSGGAEIALTSDSYEHYFPQWSPDGNWIVYHKWDATGCIQIYKVPSGVGIKESETGIRQEATDIKVYPNPFTAVISVQCSVPSDKTNIVLYIYDLSGRLVESFPLTTDHYSLTTDFSPGIYFLKAEGYKPVKVIKLR
ncbi:MAG: T9SS type A sorting domain-containing protein [Candidatus Cloacimonadota bacterium]|nr:MAG: T9SS type A sorting domain-containing protein [Candidatus Cloacimonadota bacterium]